MLVICHIYHTVENLLPHFYKHYSERGIDRFCFGVYDGKKNPVWNTIEKMGKGLNVELHHYGDGGIDAAIEGNFKEKIRNTLAPNEWFIPADLDEFHTVDGYNTFQQLQEDCEAEDADHVMSRFCDHTTEDGSLLPKLDPNVPIWNQMSRTCNLSEQVLKACCTKFCMVKQNVRVEGGHHGIVDKDHHKRFSKWGVTHHFKWFGNLYEREKHKLSVHIQKGCVWRAEHIRLLAYLNAHGGKLL